MARLTTIAIGVLVIVTMSTGCLEADLRSCRGGRRRVRRGGGLVRFETLSGQVYQRVDPARTT